MKAGRDCDAAVADKIFKRKVVWVGPDDYKTLCFDPPYWNDASQPGGFWTNTVPRYSKDISPAWEVVEKMHEDGWQFEIRTGIDLEPEYVGGPPSQVVFRRPKTYSNPQGDYVAVYSTAYTPEEESHASVICLAALKAKGVEL